MKREDKDRQQAGNRAAAQEASERVSDKYQKYLADNGVPPSRRMLARIARCSDRTAANVIRLQNDSKLMRETPKRRQGQQQRTNKSANRTSLTPSTQKPLSPIVKASPSSTKHSIKIVDDNKLADAALRHLPKLEKQAAEIARIADQNEE